MVKKQLPAEILSIAATLGYGTMTRAVCPKCGGGSDREACLSLFVGAGGDIGFRCYRASCGYRGGDGQHTAQAPKRAKEPRHYTRPYKPLTDDQEGLIKTKFGLPSGTVDGYSEVDDRFLLAVQEPRFGAVLGHVAYSLSGGKPKSLTYNGYPELPWMHWACVNKPFGIVVVEDWFSAEKVRTTGIATGVAIMGTNLNQAMVTALVGEAHYQAPCPVYIALDRDAYGKAVGYANKYKEQFKGGLYVWNLARDLKYEPTKRIADAITNRTFDFRSNA